MKCFLFGINELNTEFSARLMWLVSIVDSQKHNDATQQNIYIPGMPSAYKNVFDLKHKPQVFQEIFFHISWKFCHVQPIKQQGQLH